mmetsp:Transcript_9734/g.34554  ORF Transcript_9734/g.34554 Transcript_9734/m.34554 type:complete len:99 (+) Transcript_9734:635-931(+)
MATWRWCTVPSLGVSPTVVPMQRTLGLVRLTFAEAKGCKGPFAVAPELAAVACVGQALVHCGWSLMIGASPRSWLNDKRGRRSQPSQALCSRIAGMAG